MSYIDPLVSIIPKDQMTAVMADGMCDIDYEFLGFTKIYQSLSQIIPTHFDIVDMGCAYAPQSFIFDKHKSYTGVDIHKGERFSADNTKHFVMTIENFISAHLKDFDLNTAFAICSYVPPWGGDNIKLVRQAFKNVFTFYPAGDKCPVLKMEQS